VENKRIYTESWEGYELIDAGGGKKLERWDSIITIRPEVQAYFKPEKSAKEWNQMAHFEFNTTGPQKGEWKILREHSPRSWKIRYEDLSFHLELTKFKHVGLFPEQANNWKFIRTRLQAGKRLLNLFAYTGAASCVAKASGAETVHVDSVKQLISWARKNQEESKLSDIKWVHEDALKFVEREIKRGNRYNGIVMDPPAWGIGASGEKWKLEDKLEVLITGAKNLLQDNGFLILNTYSPTISLQEIERLAQKHFNGFNREVKELWMKTTTGKNLYYGNTLRIG
jgi:23S rRNA (cytosine1962-C5)-methyltransferase